MALLDNEELNGVENDSEDWQFVSLGEQQNFGIKTAGLEDKATGIFWKIKMFLVTPSGVSEMN